MTGVQIPVDANISALSKKIEELGRKIEALNRKPWNPVDNAQIERDADKATRKLDAVRDKEEARGKARRGEAERGPGEAEDGTRWGVRHRYTYAPEFSDVPRSALSGFGGGVSQIAGAGTRGAIAGAAAGGGWAGGLMGLLRGAGIGALAFGAFKAASAASEGIDMARERAGTLDTLKRQMGDVGISFDRLKVASEAAAYGLGINSKDFAALEQQMNVASRGADKDEMALFNATQTSAGFARSYGMDPAAAGSIFGGARGIDRRQDYRQFAMILAETIEKSGMASRADEVAQAVLSFGSLASRLSLSAPNYQAFGGAYSSMVSSGIAGLTPDVAAQILGQANAATAQMGAAGEAGQAFMFAAMQRSGKAMNPLAAAVEASGGLFGTRNSVFGDDSAVTAFMGRDYSARMRSGGDPNETNFDMVRRQLRAVNGDSDTGKLFQAESAQRLFGLQSIDQAMALLAASRDGNMGGMQALAKATGRDLSKVDYTNIQTLAKISGATDTAGLDTIYADLKTRTGTSALTQPDIENIEKNRGNVADYQKALFSAASGKDYAQDMATTARDSKAVLDTINTNIGDKLFGAITGFQDDMVTLLGGHRSLDEGRLADAEYMRDSQKKAADDYYGNARDQVFSHETMRAQQNQRYATPEQRQRLKDIEAQHDQAMESIQNQRDYDRAPSTAGAIQTMEDTMRAAEITLHNHVKVYMDANGNVRPIAAQKLGVPRAAGAQNVATN